MPIIDDFLAEVETGDFTPEKVELKNDPPPPDPGDTGDPDVEEKSQNKGDEGDEGEDTSEEELEYSVNEEGDLVDNNNNIVKKKGQFSINENGEISYNENTVGLLLDIARDNGYDLKDENGVPLEFEENEEGYVKLLEVAATEKAEKYVEEFIANNPLIVEFSNHLNSGKPAEDYFKSKINTVDLDITIDENNIEQQKTILKNALTTINNLGEVEANEFIGLIEAAGTLKEKATSALESLKQFQENKKNEIVQETKNRIEAAKKQYEEEVKTIKTAIDKGTFGPFTLKAEDKEKFSNYLFRKTNNGVSQSVEDFNNLSVEQQLLLEYFQFIKFDIDKLAEIKVKEKEANRIKNRVPQRIVVKTSKVKETNTDIDINNIN